MGRGKRGRVRTIMPRKNKWFLEMGLVLTGETPVTEKRGICLRMAPAEGHVRADRDWEERIQKRIRV